MAIQRSMFNSTPQGIVVKKITHLLTVICATFFNTANAQSTPAAISPVAQGGGPLARTATTAGTQPWGNSARIQGPIYAIERVGFRSQGVSLVCNLFVPNHTGSTPAIKRRAIVVMGPVGFVKEQAPLQYASRLVNDGSVTLIFDPRFHGESEGQPRRHESGTAKVEDIRAAIDYLITRPDVDANNIMMLGVCQGANWAIEAAIADRRIKRLAVVAGHYLTPEVAAMYVGSPERVAARVDAANAAETTYKATGVVEYMPVVSLTDATALLTARPLYDWYIRWADRSPFLAHRGLWENRLTRMSEANIWGHRIDLAASKLKTPVLMVHSDRAASGAKVPREIFANFSSSDKTQVWLTGHSQLQFYEDPITIDLVKPHLKSFFAVAKSRFTLSSVRLVKRVG